MFQNQKNEDLNKIGVESLALAAIRLIDTEINQLEKLHSSTLRYQLGQSFLCPSDTKLHKLADLRQILEPNKQTTLNALKIELHRWFVANYALLITRQNYIHCWFVPYHMSRTQKMLENINHIFALTDKGDSRNYNTSLIYP